MFYIFRQNNSGDTFDYDEYVTKFVIIEADSLEDAETKAFSIGIYYYGVQKELDCDCCGDRWWTPDESETLAIYDEPLDDDNLIKDLKSPKDCVCRVFYKNGSIAEYSKI